MGRSCPAHSPALLHEEVCLFTGLPQIFPWSGCSPGLAAETGPAESMLPPVSPEAQSGAAASQHRCLMVPKSVMGCLDEMGLKSSWAELLQLLPKRISVVPRQHPEKTQLLLLKHPKQDKTSPRLLTPRC